MIPHQQAISFPQKQKVEIAESVASTRSVPTTSSVLVAQVSNTQSAPLTSNLQGASDIPATTLDKVEQKKVLSFLIETLLGHKKFNFDDDVIVREANLNPIKRFYELKLLSAVSYMKAAIVEIKSNAARLLSNELSQTEPSSMDFKDEIIDAKEAIKKALSTFLKYAIDYHYDQDVLNDEQMFSSAKNYKSRKSYSLCRLDKASTRLADNLEEYEETLSLEGVHEEQVMERIHNLLFDNWFIHAKAFRKNKISLHAEELRQFMAEKLASLSPTTAGTSSSSQIVVNAPEPSITASTSSTFDVFEFTEIRKPLSKEFWLPLEDHRIDAEVFKDICFKFIFSSWNNELSYDREIKYNIKTSLFSSRRNPTKTKEYFSNLSTKCLQKDFKAHAVSLIYHALRVKDCDLAPEKISSRANKNLFVTQKFALDAINRCLSRFKKSFFDYHYRKIQLTKLNDIELQLAANKLNGERNNRRRQTSRHLAAIKYTPNDLIYLNRVLEHFKTRDNISSREIAFFYSDLPCASQQEETSASSQALCFEAATQSYDPAQTAAIQRLDIQPNLAQVPSQIQELVLEDEWKDNIEPTSEFMLLLPSEILETQSMSELQPMVGSNRGLQLPDDTQTFDEASSPTQSALIFPAPLLSQGMDAFSSQIATLDSDMIFELQEDIITELEQTEDFNFNFDVDDEFDLGVFDTHD